MGFRFRKSFTIIPGVKANVSNSGVSFSFGNRNARITTGKNGTYLNVGIPKTGLSYRTKLSSSTKRTSSKSISNSQLNENKAYVEAYSQQFDKLIYPHKALYGVAPLQKYQQRATELTDENRKEKLICLITGDEQTICAAIDNYIASISSDYSMNISYQMDHDQIFLDIGLPDISELPTQYPTLLKSGTLSNKNYSQTALRQHYSNLCISLAITVSANIFNLSPYIQKITLSGFVKTRDKLGDLVDQFIYSFIFDRTSFENADFKNIDSPYEFILNFPNRINLSSTYSFKTITAYDSQPAHEETIQENHTELTIEALKSLGYKSTEINRILPQLKEIPFVSDEDYLKQALKLIRQ